MQYVLFSRHNPVLFHNTQRYICLNLKILAEIKFGGWPKKPKIPNPQNLLNLVAVKTSTFGGCPYRPII